MLMNINRMLKKARKDESGFTLIELIVVVVILGILAAVVIPRIIGQTDNAQTQADNADIQIVQSAVDRYEADNGAITTSFTDLINGNYLRTTAEYPDAAAYDAQFDIHATTGKVTSIAVSN